jgi:hypothetical protein
MNREQDAAALDSSLVPLGLVLRHPEANQRAREPAHGAAHRSAGKRRHDRSGRDERADARNGQRANPGEPAERTTNNRAGAAASRRAFGRLCPFLVSEVLGPRVRGKQDRDVRVAKPGFPELVNGAFYRGVAGVDADTLSNNP